MAIKASFIPGAGLLSVFGDDLDNAVTISRNAAGLILINGGAVQIIGGQATVANTTQMLVFGQAGNDMLVLDESNGALPPAQMFGGAGNDTLTGGAGDDVLIGGGGQDVLDGGPGSNVVIRSALLVQAMASSFIPAGEGLASMPIADPGSNQPLLAQPHA